MSDQMPGPADYGMHGLCPHLVCRGAADAMEFYKKAFDATEMMRLPGPDGRLMHGSMQINGCMIMLADEYRDTNASNIGADNSGADHNNVAPPTLGGAPVTIHLVVDDCDAWTARAVVAGAKIIMPIADMFWGDRYGQIEDPFGHRWSIATSKGAPITGDALIQAMDATMKGEAL